MNEQAATAYQEALGEDVRVARYLLDRGISEEAAVTFRLGVVATTEFGHYIGRLAIPYLDRNGAPLGFRFRCLREHRCKDHDCPKYLSVSGAPSRVFNVGAIHRAGNEIHLTEGELDAVILNQLGHFACAIPGASGFQGHHRRMLAGFSRVYVWGDPDAAGSNFINDVSNRLNSAKGIRPPSGDVTETYLEHGALGIYDLFN